jgi:DNA primase
MPGTIDRPTVRPLVDQSLSVEQKNRILEEVFKDCTEALRNSQVAREFFETRSLDPLELLKSFEFGFWNGKQYSNIAEPEKRKLSSIGFFTSNGATFENSIIFPLKKNRTIVQIFGQSVIDNSSCKMLPVARQGLFLSKEGLDPQRPIILCENILDCFSLYQAGIRNVLSAIGANGVLPDHYLLLKRMSFPKIYIAFSETEHGLRAANQLRNIIKSQSLESEIIHLEKGMNINGMLCELGATELKRYFKERIAAEDIEATIRKEGEFHIVEIGSRLYRVHGLSSDSQDSLRVNIRASCNKGIPCTATVDLYSLRYKEPFIAEVSRSLQADKQVISNDINRLIVLLEEERLKLGNARNIISSEMTEADNAAAIEYLKSSNLVNRIAEDIADCGIVGNRNEALLTLFTSLSRISEKGFGLITVSRSGAGKNYLQDTVASFIPEESVLPLTRLTGQSLFYQQNINHKAITLEETVGMQDALYAIRSLLSSQTLRVSKTITDPKTFELKAGETVVTGNVSFLATTTDLSSIDFETATRFFIMHLNESSEQTEAILSFREKMAGIEGLRLKAQREKIIALQRNIQRVLEPIAVVNNIGIGAKLPSRILNSRREIGKIEALIKTIALVHQFQREIKTEIICGAPVRYIEVQQSDIDLALELAGSCIRQSLDHLSPLSRELLEDIHKLVSEKYREEFSKGSALQRWQILFTRREIADRTTWSRHHLEKHLRELVLEGYLVHTTGARGQRYTYRLVEDSIPEQPSI